jgi:hypothetical protein
MIVPAHSRLQPIQEQYVPAQPFESEQILQKNPRMPAMVGLLSQRPRQDNRAVCAHIALARGYAHKDHRAKILDPLGAVVSTLNIQLVNHLQLGVDHCAITLG